MKKSIFQLTGLLILLFTLFTGCNNTDDVNAIFTGKRWKLTYITIKDRNRMIDFWGGDVNKQKQSYEQLRATGNFTITFNISTNEGQVAQGNFDGQITAGRIMSGSWNANSRTNGFSISGLNAGNDSDPLIQEFITGLQKAHSFKGSDERNLYLYYAADNQTRCLVFALDKN